MLTFTVFLDKMSDRLQSLKVKDEVYVSEEVDYFSDNGKSAYI